MSRNRPRLRPVEIQPIEDEDQVHYLVRDPQDLGENGPLVLTPLAGWILQFLDGTTDPETIREKFREETGQALPEGTLEELLDVLDQHYLLENERSQRRQETIVRNFREQPNRPATLPGQSLPGDVEELHEFFNQTLTVPETAHQGDNPAGIILPHIDFPRGSDTYGRMVPCLEALPEMDRVLLLGISHHACPVPFALTRKTFETPFGPVHADERGVDEIESVLPYDLSRGERAHRREHSLEIPLLLLKHLRPDQNFNIVPVICSYRSERDVAESLPALVDVLRQQLDDPGTILIAGVDFAHMGTQFGDPEPLDESDYEEIERHDRAMLETIQRADADEFEHHIQSDDNRRRVCGYPALRTILPLFERADTIDYGQWQDPHGTVTYAGAALY